MLKCLIFKIFGFHCYKLTNFSPFLLETSLLILNIYKKIVIDKKFFNPMHFETLLEKLFIYTPEELLRYCFNMSLFKRTRVCVNCLSFMKLKSMGYSADGFVYRCINYKLNTISQRFH